jgi:phosphoribosylformimino-5-aminoimidazole carboxamide ribotide isomerase
MRGVSAVIAIPAIDLRDGACVQLVGGSYGDERVRLQDPCAVARQWRSAGFRRLHVVDLDAATARGTNGPIVEKILNEAPAGAVQAGGGVRSTERVEELITSGAGFVIAGTRAIQEPAWLEQVAMRYRDRLIVAADTRGRQVVTHGWSASSPRDVVELIRELATVPIAAVLVTAVHCEGRMEGTDLALMEDVVASAHVPVFAAGGVGSMTDLRALALSGVAATVIGMALYTGALDARAVAEEFSE